MHNAVLLSVSLCLRGVLCGVIYGFLCGVISVFLLLHFTCSLAWTAQGGRQPVNVLVITIDTLRPDHLGCYGYLPIHRTSHTSQTPNIDALARQGVMFGQAFTPVPITLPSHISLFTGLYPQQHGVLDNGSFLLKKDALTLAEILKAQGFTTGAIIASSVLDSIFGLDQGFTSYDDHMPRQGKAMAVHFNERRAAEVTELATAWIKGQSQKRLLPFFLWLHYFDPHAPYDAPDPFGSQYSNADYDGEIAYTDYWLGILIQELKKQGLFEKTLIVLTTDHGEGLGEHQESTHGNFLYDSTLKVPLIFKLSGKLPSDHPPKQINKPQQINSPEQISIPQPINSLVRTIDILPTILDLLGLSAHIPKKIDGQSMRPLIQAIQTPIKESGEGKASLQQGERSLSCETYYPLLHYGWSPELGLRTAKWKYIEAPKPELYDLVKDPGEKNNLFKPQDPVASELRSRLANTIDLKKVPSSPYSSAAQPNRTMLERLQSLGYLQAKIPISKPQLSKVQSSKPQLPKDQLSKGQLSKVPISDAQISKVPISQKEWKSLPDVKDRVNILRQMDEGVADMAKENYQEALRKFTAIVKSDPANVSGLFYQACLYQKLGSCPAAIAAFKKILDLDPTHLDIHNHLGTIYHEMKDPNQAIREFQQEIGLHPDYLDAHYNLAVDYVNQGKIQQAWDTILTVLRLDQNYAEGYNLRGKIRLRKADLRKADFSKADPAREKEKSAGCKVHNAEQNSPRTTHNAQSLKEAEEDFQKAISLLPEYAEAHNNLGVLYSQQKKYAQALKELTIAKDLDPQNAGILINLATTELQQYQCGQAEKHFQQALSLQPDSIEAREGLGRICTQDGRLEKARALLDQVIKTSPKRSQTHFLLGQVYALQDFWQKARKEWEETIRLDPGHDQACVKLGNLLFQHGQSAEAFTNWQKAISLNPRNLEAYHNLGAAYYQQGKMKEAIKAWKSILLFDPNSASAHLHLGSAWFQQGDTQTAISEWKRAIEIEPNNFEALSNLGSAYIQKGKTEEARKNWQRAVDLQPNNADLHFNLAIIFLQQGAIAKGESELEKVLRINPNYPKAGELLQKARAAGKGQ